MLKHLLLRFLAADRSSEPGTSWGSAWMLRGMVGILEDRIMQPSLFLRALGQIHRLSFGFQRIYLGIFERVFFLFKNSDSVKTFQVCSAIIKPLEQA